MYAATLCSFNLSAEESANFSTSFVRACERSKFSVSGCAPLNEAIEAKENVNTSVYGVKCTNADALFVCI